MFIEFTARQWKYCEIVVTINTVNKVVVPDLFNIVYVYTTIATSNKARSFELVTIHHDMAATTVLLALPLLHNYTSSYTHYSIDRQGEEVDGTLSRKFWGNSKLWRGNFVTIH